MAPGLGRRPGTNGGSGGRRSSAAGRQQERLLVNRPTPNRKKSGKTVSCGTPFFVNGGRAEI
ncbi:MAG: hypothetical protein ACPGJA_03905 [Candidatus Thalassarchaeaceae archaeon]